MHFVPMKQLLDKALAGGYAVPGFCVWSAETMKAVLDAAARLNAPVILMSGPCEFRFMSPAVMAAVGRAVAGPYDVKAAFHLDHGDSMPMVADALAGGYSSVMLDFSTRPFAENAGALRRVVELARPLGATVEGEIGAVGKVDAVTREGGTGNVLTDPTEAEAYVKATGVDALAVAIGNAHGLYTKLPELDFVRLEKIRRKVSIPLVLHGGSGTPDDALKKAIALGMAKVNVASELIHGYRESLQAQWAEQRNLWTPEAAAVAARATIPIAERWIRRVGAEGKAG
jgi:tagatose 1,6-diphosphate aldolase GatY/KbaY